MPECFMLEGQERFLQRCFELIDSQDADSEPTAEQYQELEALFVEGFPELCVEVAEQASQSDGTSETCMEDGIPWVSSPRTAELELRPEGSAARCKTAPEVSPGVFHADTVSQNMALFEMLVSEVRGGKDIDSAKTSAGYHMWRSPCQRKKTSALKIFNSLSLESSVGASRIPPDI